jgi:serine/threonine-protein kinase
VIRLHLLGSIELRHGDGTAARSVLAQPKRVALLAYLALARPLGYRRRDELLALFWPEKDDQRARSALRQSVHFLRKFLGDGVITSRGDGEIGLNGEQIWVDVSEVDRLAAGGQRSEALALYRGGLMDSFHVSGAAEFDRWLDEERRRLRHLAWRLAMDESSSHAEGGSLAEAVALAGRAVQIRPLNEAGARAYMTLLFRAGDRSGALMAYEQLKVRLADRLNTEPEAETRVLADSMRQGDGAAGGHPSVLVEDSETLPSDQLSVRRRPSRILSWGAAAAAGAMVTYVVFPQVVSDRFERYSAAVGESDNLPRHVLWVDDEPVNNAEEVRFLRDQGVRVTTATSTSDALRIYDPSRHDIVLSDMGRWEGEEFIERAGIALLQGLRQADDDLRLVFFTSPGAIAGAGEQALAAGAAGITSSTGELVQLLRSLSEAKVGRVVMAEFESTPGEEQTARALALAVRGDLEQSTHMVVVPRQHVDRTLRRMERDTDQPVSLVTASEVARREGYGAVVGGRVARTEGGWVLTVSLHLPDGTLLHSDTKTVADAESLLPAFDSLSRSVRASLGENAASLSSRAPLPEVTTSSYEALLAFAEGVERMSVSDYAAAQGLFEQALQLDSSFAAAWARLGGSHRNRSQWPQAVDALERAHALRDRLSPLEKLSLDFQYAEIVTGDTQAARAASTALLELRPDLRDVWLSQQVLMAFHQGEWEEGARRATELKDLMDGLPATSWWNLVALQLINGRDAAADSSLDRWEMDLGPQSEVLGARFRVAFQRQEWELAEGILDGFLRRDPDARHGLEYWYSLTALGAGKLSRADRRFDLWIAEEADLGRYPGVVEQIMWAALADLEIRHDTARARSRMQDVRPYLEEATASGKLMAAWVSAAAGDPREARRILDVYEDMSSRFDLERRPREFWAAEGSVSLAEGDPDTAARIFRRGHEAHMGRPFECQFCPTMLLGRAHDMLGDTVEAIELYRELVNARWIFGPDRQQDAAFLVPVRERLAELHEARAERSAAAVQYREILRQWTDADAVLQPRVQAARDGLDRTGGS